MRQWGCTLLVIVGVVFPLKGYGRIVDRDDSMVGNSDPMCVTSEILEYVFRAAKRRLGVDDPVFIF
jgi:hypothetical protein